MPSPGESPYRAGGRFSEGGKIRRKDEEPRRRRPTASERVHQRGRQPPSRAPAPDPGSPSRCSLRRDRQQRHGRSRRGRAGLIVAGRARDNQCRAQQADGTPSVRPTVTSRRRGRNGIWNSDRHQEDGTRARRSDLHKGKAWGKWRILGACKSRPSLAGSVVGRNATV